MNGLRTKLALEAHLRMLSQLPVRTHLRPEPIVRKKNINYAAAKDAGKLGRKTGWK